MENKISQMGCGCCGLSRRNFLKSGCTACIGAGVGASTGLLLPRNERVYAATGDGKMTVRVLFSLHAPVQPGPDWPNVGFDFQPVMEKTMNALSAGCKEITFISSMANGPEQAKAIIDEDTASGKVDAYLVMQLNCWNRVVQDAVASGKPVLYADFLYAGSGGFLVYTAGFLRGKAPNFAHLSSGRVADLVAAANCFLLAGKEKNLQAFVNGVNKVRKEKTAPLGDMKCLDDKVDTLSTSELLKTLKGKKMLEVERGWAPVAKEAKESLGIEIVQIPFTELNGAWEKADKAKAAEFVERWKKTATLIDDVSDETLETSARMYLGQKDLLKKHGAEAITVNCLGGFYGNHIHAYPCLGFHELLNEGLIGACECDTISTLTMLTMTTLTKGRPGYISDPVVDVAARQIIYAHCVSSNKPFGPDGPESPFEILTHSEDRQGASVRATLPSGYMTTTLEMSPAKKQIVFHQGKAVGNSREDRACRTKLAVVPVGDFEKIFNEWDQWGWHRVTYYGDLKEQVFALADAIGWKIIEEA